MINRPLKSILFILTGLSTVFGFQALAQDELYNPVIDPANFVAVIENPYWPLTPGTTYIYEGETEEGLERIQVTVTHDTRNIMGVDAVVVRDTVWLDGEIIEDTFDWYAQDIDGNVWYFGEDSREFEDGIAVNNAGSWEAGIDGALPGIVMWAEPEVGATYRQEFYAEEAEDMAEVLSLEGSVSVRYGDFEDVLVTREWTPLEPGVAENKYYAAGIGLLLEEVVDGEEQIELVDMFTEDCVDDDDADDDGDESSEADDMKDGCDELDDGDDDGEDDDDDDSDDGDNGDDDGDNDDD